MFITLWLCHMTTDASLSMSLKIATLSRAMPLDRAMPSEARFVHSEVTVNDVYGSAPLTFREVNIFGLLESW